MATTDTTEKKAKIDRHMTIEGILSSFPGKAQALAHTLTSAGLHCVGCGAATWETLEAGVLGHGMSEEALDQLEAKLNAVLEQEEDLTTITLTPKAASKFFAVCEEEGMVGYGLRFEERAAGCSGFEYHLDFSEKSNPDDTIFESEGIEIHVNNAMAPRLIGSSIDYVDGLSNSGFKVSNPNARSSCGCGTSHGY